MVSSHWCCLAVLLALTACGGSTRRASTPHGKATTTAATIGPKIERLVVIEPGSITMVARGGCVASVKTSEGQAGPHDELRVRCPKPERLRTWLDGANRVTASLAVEPTPENEDDEEEEGPQTALPAAKLLTTSGVTLRVSTVADVRKLAAEVNAFAAELASTEAVAPGPASPAGWEMLHVTGPAHVLFAGTPARGVLEARMSTNGQYLCEFITNVGDGPMRASKSGWIAPSAATKVIDEVLRPWAATEPHEKPKTTYAAGTRGGAEQRSADSSTAAVFERFAQVQDALGDACLPELEPPQGPSVGL